MGKSNPFKLMLEGLNCANCANKIEERVNRLELVEEANLNFSTSQLIVKLYDESMKSQAIEEIKSIVKQLEPDVVVSEKTQLVTQVKQSQNKEIKLLLEGLNCANCANKIEDRVNQLASVESANLNFSTSQLSVTLEDGAIKQETLVEIKSIINKLEPDVVVSEKVSTVTGKISSCQDSSCSTHDHDTHEHSHEHFDA